MLNRSITYRLLLRVAGVLLLLWALYSAFRIATEPIGEIFADGRTDVRLQIQISFTDDSFHRLFGSTLLCCSWDTLPWSQFTAIEHRLLEYPGSRLACGHFGLVPIQWHL